MTRIRLIFLLSVLVVPLVSLETRLFWLQVVRHSEYSAKVHDRRTRIEIIPTSRGRIFDRAGELLAADRRQFDLSIVLYRSKVDGEVLGDLAVLLNRSAAGLSHDISAVQDRIEKIADRRTHLPRQKVIEQESRYPYPLLEDIPFEAAIAIETQPDRFPGFVVREKHKRVYPHGTAVSHIVGYVSNIDERTYKHRIEGGIYLQEFGDLIGEEEFNSLERRGYFQNDVIGMSGVEKARDQMLRGQRGARIVERDFRTRQKRILAREKPILGMDLKLTVDARLQQLCIDAMGTETGVIAVMDVRSGELVAMASTPVYDNNDLVPPVSREAYERNFGEHSNRRTTNRAVQDSYPLGSIFKMVTSAAILENGTITPHSTVTCDGLFDPKYNRFKCWIYREYGSTHGPLTVSGALKHSCNVFYYRSANKAGIVPIVNMASMMGFGRRSGIDLPYESRGALPVGQSFSETLSFSIGQGGLLTTPIQVVRMIGAIANGGILQPPHVVKGHPTGPAIQIDFKPGTLESIREGMYKVLHEERGTASLSELADFDTSGKTSSAQTIPSKPAHAWFGGFYPIEKPRYAYVVFVEYGKSGSAAAAPRAARTLEALEAWEKGWPDPNDGNAKFGSYRSANESGGQNE